jgi:predicted ATP-grasp superfamily ATP-dependent carboligase
MMARILVTDGNQRSTLAVVRSLGKKGAQIIVGEESLPCLASSSRYCRRAVEYPSPYEHASGFLDFLIEELSRDKYSMVIPMTDISSYIMMENYERIAELSNLPFPKPNDYFKAIDKLNLVDICHSQNIPAPETYRFDDIEDLKDRIESLPFPLVVKPRQSISFSEGKFQKKGVRYVYSPEELITVIEEKYSDSLMPLLQERIVGDGTGAFFLFNNGNPCAVFCHRRLREKPPSGGVSVLRESVRLPPQMEEYGIKLLKHLNWHGVAMVEFKYDNRDGLPKIMEINARFWGSLQLAIDSGVDFPGILYDMTINGSYHPKIVYNTGVKTRWLLGDLDNLLAIMFKSRKTLNLTENHPGRLKTFWEFIKFFKADTKYEVLRRDDFKPFLFELRSYISDLVKKK